MALPQIKNCPKCGKIYLRVRDICDDCFQKQELDYLSVADYLRDYPGSTIHEVSEATHISVSQIRQFILAGRILIGNFPNLSYPCEVCGSMIKTGKRCKNCNETISRLAQHGSVGEDENNEKERIGKDGGYFKNYL